MDAAGDGHLRSQRAILPAAHIVMVGPGAAAGPGHWHPPSVCLCRRWQPLACALHGLGNHFFACSTEVADCWCIVCTLLCWAGHADACSCTPRWTFKGFLSDVMTC